MTPTETLKHEHQVILLVMDGVEREAESLRTKGTASYENIRKIVDFARSFTDRCHHGKEEKHLFPAMERHGQPHDQGPIAVMLLEHAQGRELVKAIAGALPLAEQGDPSALGALRDSLTAYAQLLRAHIAKENNVLFPLADRLLTPEDQKALGDAFDRVETEEMGEGTHEKYHQLAHELGKKT
jgi:hemerythrin-like domain-containing protein